MIRSITRVWSVASLPAAILHELAHAVVALPFADAVSVEFAADGRATCHVDWSDPPDWGLLLTAYAPLWLGASVAVAGGWAWLTGAWSPETTREWLLSAALAGYWVIFVAHDPRDRGGGEG